MTKLSFFGLTDVGRVRQRNEDNWAAHPDRGIFLVADGMGGAARGDLASQIVADTLPTLLPQSPEDLPEPRMEAMAQATGESLIQLSARVSREADSRPELRGMGSTVVLAWLSNLEAIIAHMGDSRAYVLRKGRLHPLTRDHSLVQMLVDFGEIELGEARTHPARNQITRCVGMPGEPMPEVAIVELEPRDLLILCSDGLTGMIEDAVIEGILTGCSAADSPLEECARALVDAANNAGGHDNVTVLLIRVDGPHAVDG